MKEPLSSSEFPLIELLEMLPDPREDYKVQHKLSTIIFCTLCAVLCGAEGWTDIVLFCEIRREWLSQYVEFKNGIPSSWTFRRVFSLLKPELIETLLRSHSAMLLRNKGENPATMQICVDGKALRGSKRHDARCLQVITAFSHEHGVVLAQKDVETKSNEITAIPLLLDVLQLKGNTISIDAAGCQREIAEQIIDAKGDYVLALKKNHPKLYQEVEDYVQTHAITASNRLEDRFDDGHGRCVRRRYFATDISHLPICQEWKGLRSVVAVETITSQPHKLGETSAQWRYYLTSHNRDMKGLHQFVRHHWSIENRLHWVLDVIMGEDADRKSERNSTRAFAALKRMAINIVRLKQPKQKASLRSRLKLAAWNEDYLTQLLT
jgi:predicted transposase YbfD/YdcC